MKNASHRCKDEAHGRNMLAGEATQDVLQATKHRCQSREENEKLRRRCDWPCYSGTKEV